MGDQFYFFDLVIHCVLAESGLQKSLQSFGWSLAMPALIALVNSQWSKRFFQSHAILKSLSLLKQ